VDSRERGHSPEKRKVGGSTPPLTTDHSEHPLALSPARTAGRETALWRRPRSRRPRSPQKSHNRRLLRPVGLSAVLVVQGCDPAAVHGLAPRYVATLAATRGDDRVVVEVEGGITVYPARCAGDRWRAVWYEDGRRRQCESVSEAGLAVKLERVSERLAVDAPNMERPGADLIAHYLSPDRHPASKPWSRKHADTQARLCARYLAPVIAGLVCQDIKTAHLQGAVNAAPTAGEGGRDR
jgi:hypothetical protein